MKSWTKPTPEAVDQAIASAPRAEQLQYFLSKLENPEWLDPLAEREFFTSPLSPVFHEEGTVSFPLWPQAQYLVRVAPFRPDKVIELIRDVPGTENFRIHESFIDALLAMPAEKSAQLTSNVLLWFDNRFGFHLGEQLGKLISHLAKGGQVQAALEIARSLFGFRPDPKFDEKKAQRETYLISPSLEPLPRIESWRYERVLKKYLAELVESAAIETVDLLAAQLERIIELSSFEPEKQKPVDLSAIWRPAIESHSQNWGHSLKDYVVSALRSGSESAIRSGKVEFEAVDALLATRKWDIFERMRINLVRMFPEKAGPRVASILTDKAAFQNISYRHEYSMLLTEQFKNLSNQEQQLVLDLIAVGPDSAERTFRGEEKMSDEDWEAYKKYWTARNLKPIEKDLPSDWATKFSELVAEVGQPTHYDTVISRGRIKVGSESPKTFEELNAMSVPQLVEFMATWTPSNDFEGPSADGLAHVFGKVVTAKPQEFSEAAESFKGSDATYVRALISGLSGAVKNGQQLNWPPILVLFEFILNKSTDINEARRRSRTTGGHDPDWSWARRAIPGLLRNALQEGDGEAPIAFRESIWRILTTLAKDPDPTPQHETQSSLDAATLSINCCRGETLHAVVEYALWVYRHDEDAAKKGFEMMPEVQAVLEEHLDMETEPSVAIRTIYGQYFPWLHLLDKNWAAKNVARIFPSTAEYRRFHDAAWETYVIFNSPYDSVFDALEDQYRFAIEIIPRNPTSEGHFGNPVNRLAEHLMALYWRGKIDFSDPDSHLAVFFRTAPAQVRTHALSYVGQSVGRTKEGVPTKIRERLVRLWEWRLGKITDTDEQKCIEEELAAFSWWFSSGGFDQRWASSQLIKVLSIIKSLPDDYLVMEQLAAISAELPLEAVQILKAMTEGIPDQRWWFPSDDEVRVVLRNAFESNNDTARRTARETRDLLLSFGYFQFRD